MSAGAAVAKRRFKSIPSDRDVEELSPEERRAQRKRERAQGGGASKSAKGLGSTWRRGAIVGVSAAAVIVIALLLILNPFHAAPPCITLENSPVGAPGFPPKGTTDFSQTWCPQNVPTVYAVQPYLQIYINGQHVSFPAAIGQNANFSGYTCVLPIATHRTNTPNGLVDFTSPWPYHYNLSAFFSVWSQSYSGAYVNATSPSQPIVYQNGNLLGYTSDASHQITLFVDNQLSSQGPTLNLETLAYSSNAYPSCMASIYGTGHTVVLSYKSTKSTAFLPGIRASSAESAAYDPRAALRLYEGPAPHFGLQTAERAALERAHWVGLPWLALRPGV